MREDTRTLSVMIVDDDRDGADSLAEVFRLFGHQVKVAYTPTTAVIEAGSFTPDVVLMDIGIPGLDGYRLARRLCDLFDRRPVLVAVTGYGGLEDRSRREGFDHHVVKPADPSALLALLGAHASGGSCVGPVVRRGRARQPVEGPSPAE